MDSVFDWLAIQALNAAVRWNRESGARCEACRRYLVQDESGQPVKLNEESRRRVEALLAVEEQTYERNDASK